MPVVAGPGSADLGTTNRGMSENNTSVDIWAISRAKATGRRGPVRTAAVAPQTAARCPLLVVVDARQSVVTAGVRVGNGNPVAVRAHSGNGHGVPIAGRGVNGHLPLCRGLHVFGAGGSPGWVEWTKQ